MLASKDTTGLGSKDIPGVTRPEAPWQHAEVYPNNPMPEGWGLHWKGATTPMDLPALLEQFRLGPGKILWNGVTERTPVMYVAAPGESRICSIQDRPEFGAAVLEREEVSHASSQKRTGGLFFFFAGLCVLLAAIGAGHAAFLPALFAVEYGRGTLEARLALRRLRQDPARYLALQSALARYQYWGQAGPTWRSLRTYTLIGSWIVVGALQALVALSASLGDPRPDLAALALVKARIPEAPWRLMTGPMLHGSLMHLWMNAMAMLSLGSLLERGVHRHLVVPLWLAGALAGSLCSWWLLPGTSVGASGGLMALFGFLLIAAWRRRRLLPPDVFSNLLRSLLALALMGVLAWAVIDNTAHAGGLLAGLGVGIWVFRAPEGNLPLQDYPHLRWIGLAAEATFLGLAGFTAFQLIRAVHLG